MARLIASFVTLVLAVLPSVAAAGDCAGGTILGMQLARRVRFHGSITRAGITHDTLVAAPEGFSFQVVDAANGTVLHSVSVPADRFATNGSTTRYIGGAPFTGKIILRNSHAQADTVTILVTEPTAALPPSAAPFSARVFINGGALCTRSCAAACTAHGKSLNCKRSQIYEPALAEGFGKVKGGRGPRSAFCGLAIDTSQPCDFLIEERCLLPYPSSAFLKSDPSTPTGLRIDYGPQALPANVSNVHVDPTDWNTLDGFSPGPAILSLFPDTGFPVDLSPTGSNAAFHTNYARSLDADHPTVLMDESGNRVVHFAEMDVNTSDVTRKALIIRPGKRLDDGTRYLVAIRNLVDTLGNPIKARLPFRALRALALGQVTAADLTAACGANCSAAIAARASNFADIFSRLNANGVDPEELVLAWDFTTASTQALTGWIKSVRDQAFALGTPTFTVTSVNTNSGAGFNANIWARIQGTFQAPLFMTADAPASRLNLVGGVPAQNGFATVPFVVDVPRIAYNGGADPLPGRPSTWGHGLLGNRFQLGALSQVAQLYDFVIAAVDMQGMSDQDVGPAVIPLTQDVSLFHYIPERLHQGFLNHLLLGRLLGDPVNGFNSDPAFKFGPSQIGIIDTTEVYYSGGSQGGIFGVAIMSIAEDFKRGFVAVPAANYSTLLHRSVDFNPYLALQRSSYPDRLDEELLLALIQQLWDRAEPQGYMNHLISGDLSTPPVPHKVLIHMATYDCEVSNVGTEIMVRSLGVPQLRPVHRSFFQIPEIDAAFDGSAFVEIDPQRGFSRCDTVAGGSPGAACTTNADCPGIGDPPTRTVCDSGIPPLTNSAPRFNNGAHGSTGTLATAAQLDKFFRPAGDVEQFCVGTCDPQ
jgi:hypothetical protein